MGLAVGDAVGTTVEFEPPGAFHPVTDMVGGGPFDLPAGAWTDDTSMTLCLAESLIECAGFNPVDQLERYVRWRRDGHLSSIGRCFDIGNTTSRSLARFERSGDPFPGGIAPEEAGNGSLMRLAPVAMAYANRPAEAILLAGESSRTTHGVRECVDACRFFAALLLGALAGVGKDELIRDGAFELVPGLWERAPLAPKIYEVACGSFRRKKPPEIQGDGYVVRSLEAALWAFASTDSFEDGVLAAVNLGRDADTTAAIYGQIGGAFYGSEAIPQRWRERLVDGGLIEQFADELHKLAERPIAGLEARG